MEFENCPPDSPVISYTMIHPSTVSQKKLRIPDTFAETYGNELSGVISLVTPDGYIWHVKLDKSNDKLFFSDGWQNIVQHYSISSEHALGFKYRGNSCFNVFIYDKTSTEIDYSRNALGSCVGPESYEHFFVSDVEETDSDLNSLTSSMKSRDYCPGNSKKNGKKMKTSLEKGKQVIPERVGQPRKHSKTADETKQESISVANGKDGSDAHETLVTSKEKAEKLGIKPCFLDFLRSTLLTSQEKKRALFASRVFSSENPSFMVVIRQHNLDKACQMDAPVEFSARYLLPRRRVELEIGDRRRWTVYSMETKGGLGLERATLKRGWATFTEENNLEIGDICIFEVIRVENIVLRVSIFRSNQGDEIRQASSHAANEKDGSDERESLLAREEEAAKLGIKACFVDFFRSTLLTSQEKELAIIACKEFTSDNPCFMAIIRQCNLHKTYQMDAPVEFSAKYLLPSKRVELEIANGKRWTVYSTGINRGLGGAILKRGWATFARANHLEVGDVCIFEVIRVEFVVLKVSIHRSKQDK